MQPTADATNYMLKSNYATNGQPGVVDHALLADTVTILPKHALQHLQTGNDPINVATTFSDGLCPAGNGDPSSYLGGDIQLHSLPLRTFLRAETAVSLQAGTTSGAVIATGILANPSPGVYVVDAPYLYAPSPGFTPAGLVHFEVYDTSIPGWVQVTQATDISVLTAPKVVARPVLLSAAMLQSFAAGPNQLTWRLVLDQTQGVTCYFTAGINFFLSGLQTLP
jgi:hypothetical protein